MTTYDAKKMFPKIQQQQLIEGVWASALEQLRRGSSEIVLTSVMRDAIGQQGIAAIADRFR